MVKAANDTIADEVAEAVRKADIGGRSFAIVTKEIGGRRYVVMPLDVYQEDVERPKRRARALASAKDELAEALHNLRRGYLGLLESGRDRIIFLGGKCDPFDRMVEGDPYLRAADAALAKHRGER